MTYKIFKDNGEIIFRSKICPAEDKKDPNRHLRSSDGERCTPPTVIKSRSDDAKRIVYSSDDAESDSEDALVHNKDLIGRTFL